MAVRQRRLALRNKLAELEREKSENMSLIEKKQQEIRLALRTKWPEIRYPYTQNFMQFLFNNLTEAQQLVQCRV